MAGIVCVSPQIPHNMRHIKFPQNLHTDLPLPIIRSNSHGKHMNSTIHLDPRWISSHSLSKSRIFLGEFSHKNLLISSLFNLPLSGAFLINFNSSSTVEISSPPKFSLCRTDFGGLLAAILLCISLYTPQSPFDQKQFELRLKHSENVTQEWWSDGNT